LNLVDIPDSAIEKSLRNACDESQYLIQLNNMDHRMANPGDHSGAIMHITMTDSKKADDPKP